MNQVVLDVIEDGNGRYQAVLPQMKVHTATYPANFPTDTKPQVTQGLIPIEETQGFDWAPWGMDDCLPTIIRQKIEEVPIAGRTISQLIAKMYGNGLCYHRNSDLYNGGNTIQRAYSKKIEDWLYRSRIRQKWLIAQFSDYRYYMNAFSEMILNKRRDFITGLYHKPAEFSRLSKQNPQSLDIEYLYFSPEFSRGYVARRNTIKKIPLFRWYDEEQFLQSLNGFKFAYHSRFETPGILYYARAFWLGLFRENGWMDASKAVPEVVNAMMQNQIRIKYQILIPESYFLIRDPQFATYTAKQRMDIIDELIDEINNKLVGTSNAYVSISSVFREDMAGKPEGKVEILSIDDKVKKDAWVPSSTTADAQIVQGLGEHPSQVGLANDHGKMGAGSGSDQRESFNTSITLNTIDQDIVLEPLNLIARFNAQVDPEWDITFYIDHTYHTTTNNQETGLNPSSTTLQIE